MKIKTDSKVLVIKFSGYAVVGSVILLVDQVRKIRKIVNDASSADVLSIDRIQPTYIYIEDPHIQEQIEAGNMITKERLKLTRIQRWLHDKIEESFIFRNFYSYKKNLAWRFLSIAKEENRSYRYRAVRSLATLDNLTDSDYQQLAQSCDVRTTVGLARTTTNLKFFLDPPYYKQKPERHIILKNLHDFFLALDIDATHPCLQYFISKVFNDALETDYKGFDDDLGVKINQNEYIPMCVEALLHHSCIGSNAKDIVTLGGLPLLMEVFKYLQQEDSDNTDCLIMLSRLISNMSVYESVLQDFYVSGWIKILAILSQHKDIRVAAPAQRALFNFDLDEEIYGGHLKFHRRIYPLYPTQRIQFQPKLDVIFIHGLLGGVFITWRQRDYNEGGHKSPLELLGIFSSDMKKSKKNYVSTPGRKNLENDFFFTSYDDINEEDDIEKDYMVVLADIPVDANTISCEPFFTTEPEPNYSRTNISKCWPKDWLSKDCPDVRIIGVNYETNVSMWTPMCPTIPSSRKLNERSTHILHKLTKAGVGRRPIVWVAHSMGGLLVKDMLVQASASEDPEKQLVYQNTKGIVFYSTPHKGSHLAALNPTSQMIIWPSVEVQELRQNSPALLSLHEDFLKIVKKNPFKVISFAERESTYVTSMKFEVRFVDDSSADPDIGEMYGIALDHLSICKPSCKQSFLYQKVLKLIREILGDKSKSYCGYY